MTPTLIFDGDCGFCTGSVEWLERRLAREVVIVPWQRAELAHWGLTEADARRYAWWVDEAGRAHRGHRAAARALRASRGAWPLVGWLLLVPPLSWLAAVGYRLVAKTRGHLPGTTPACRNPAWDEAGRPPADRE